MNKLELFKYLKDGYFFELERRRKVKSSFFLEMLPITIPFLIFTYLIPVLTPQTHFYIFSFLSFCVFLLITLLPIIISDLSMVYFCHNYKDGTITISEYNKNFLDLNPNNEALVSDSMLDFMLDRVEKANIENHRNTNIIVENQNKIKKFLPFIFILMCVDLFIFTISFLK